jgi:hypothetical protein
MLDFLPQFVQTQQSQDAGKDLNSEMYVKWVVKEHMGFNVSYVHTRAARVRATLRVSQSDRHRFPEAPGVCERTPALLHAR